MHVFDVEKDSNGQLTSEFNMRKLVKAMSHINEEYLYRFSETYEEPIEDVIKAFSYCSNLTSATIKRKALNRFEELKRDKFFQLLKG
jgi:hypothetical protein